MVIKESGTKNALPSCRTKTWHSERQAKHSTDSADSDFDTAKVSVMDRRNKTLT